MAVIGTQLEAIWPSLGPNLKRYGRHWDPTLSNMAVIRTELEAIWPSLVLNLKQYGRH